MAVFYNIPSSAELQQIGADKVARVASARLSTKFMPRRRKKVAILAWQQKDNTRGLQQLRGSGGAPSYIKLPGSKRFLTEPGYYGEYYTIPEDELNKRAGAVIGNATVDAKDLVMEAQDTLIQREADLIEYIWWAICMTGTINITGPNGAVYSDTFQIQTHLGSDWSNLATATPLADLRTIAATKGVGRGLNFKSGATMVVNSVTAMYLLNNQNPNDLGGKLVSNGSTINDMDGLSKLFVANGLPALVVYDEGYFDDSNNWNYYVATDKVAIIAKRVDGDTICQYTETINHHARNGVGPYEFLKDYFKGVNAPVEVPGRIEVHRGHNGGVELYHPGALLVMSV